MDGYSVTEAASVLGVPTERVWELLARGVLSGAPEGETGMRVFLQPRSAPAAQPERPNGNGGSGEPARELSPFRELLTEFRSLTERYGQALLALGEARGEVAALRSRVDLLEARIDLRLPASERGGAPPWATPAPFPTERQVVPVPPEPAPAAVAEPAHDAEEEEHRARGRGPRRATQSFAEALARAQDPSIPELPGGPEAAAALASLRASIEHEPATAEAALPRELPLAEPVLVADEEPSARDEPDARQAEPEPEPETQPEPEPPPVEHEAAPAEDATTAVEPTPAEVEPASGVGTVPDPETPNVGAEAETALPEQAEASEPVEPALQPTAAELVAAPEAQETGDAGDTAVPRAEEAAPPDEIAQPEPLAWDSQRYTTTIVEPDWLPADEPPFQAAVADEAPQEPDTVADRDEETVLWWGRSPENATGASEMEIAGAHPSPGPSHPSDASPVSPEPQPKEDRSESLDEGLAALDAILRPAPEKERATEAWPPERPIIQPPARPVQRTAPPPRPLPRPIGPTPASRAYRRLRRIFPG